MRRSLVRRIAVLAAGACLVSLSVCTPQAVAAEPAAPVHWSFESGTLDGWRIVEGSFGKIVDDRPDFRNRRIPMNKEGTYYLSTMEKSDGTYSDGFTGVVVSPRFTLTHPVISALVAGGSSSQQYVAVCTVDTTAPYDCHEVARTEGPQDEILRYHSFDVGQYLGQTVFVEVVDHATGGWGHISLDDVRANAPAMPHGLSATHDNAGVTVRWQPVPESGIAGYNIYRSTRFDTGFRRLNAAPLTDPSYRDTTATPDGRYFYRVEALGSDSSVSEQNVTYTRQVEDVYAQGGTHTYTGANLSAIRFPVGPLGAGGIVSDGTGRRPTWWIFNNDNYPSDNQLDKVGNVPNSFFAVRAQAAGHAPVVRALQTTPQGPFPAMRSLSFQGEYPLGRYRFQDPALPVSVSEQTYSPMIPGDVKDSSIPTAIYTITLTNSGRTAVRVSVLATQQNAVGFDGYGQVTGPNQRSFPGYGDNTNTVQSGSHSTRLQLTGDAGSMTLSALATHGAGTASWDSTDSLLAQFIHDGAVSGPQQAHSPAAGQTVDGALTVRATLAPGHSVTVPFVLSWYFPHATHFFAGDGEQYTNWWTSAADVDRYVTGHFAYLSGKTRLYHDTFYDSNIPHYVLDRLTSTTALLHTPTVFWTKGGYFGAEEGYGCCYGMPNHVWEYAQGQAHLWPTVARQWTQQYLDDEQPNGTIDYRYHVPVFAMDGQTGVILGAYRDYRNTGDTAWLNNYWPKIKAATNYVVNTFDPDHDGMLHGAQYNTLDSSESGTGPWMGSMYLAAVAAASRMARVAGDTSTADTYQTIVDRGRANQDAALWNGSYYQEHSQHLPGTKEIDDGVDIDMLLGQWWAMQVGLGDIYPSAHTTTAAQTLFAHNYKANSLGDNPYFHIFGRGYVEKTDAGMMNITWPKNDRPLNSPPYFDETWTGTEYVAAATLISRGLVGEGLKVMRAVADRYDGRLRDEPFIARGGCATGQGTGNPFGDDECGKWYGRSLSSWSVLQALQGFGYDAATHTVTVAPAWRPDDHRSFFSAGKGWGTFSQQRTGSAQKDSLALKYGTLALHTVTLTTAQGAAEASTVSATLNGAPVSIASVEQHNDRTTVTLATTHVLHAGDTLVIHG